MNISNCGHVIDRSIETLYDAVTCVVGWDLVKHHGVRKDQLQEAVEEELNGYDNAQMVCVLSEADKILREVRG